MNNRGKRITNVQRSYVEVYGGNTVLLFQTASLHLIATKRANKNR